MTVHVMCLTSSGGIPVFTRKKGDGDPLSFTSTASLNGVHMFLKSHNVELLATNTPDTSVVWKEFENSVTLITIASGTTKIVLQKFLDAVFAAMVLIVGIEDIKHPRNIERLKRDLRNCTPIIDRLLECLDIGDKMCSRTDFVDMTDCVMFSENHLLQICLEGYMENLDSMYGCVLIHECLAVATESWWSLDAVEKKLLVLAVTADGNHSTRDLPVFLPYKSPNLAFRLVSITLLNNVQILSLIGPTPELAEVEKLAAQCWRNSLDALRTAEQTYPKSIPLGASLDAGILGFLLSNYKVGKFVVSRNSQSSKTRVSGAHKLDNLKSFYHYAVDTFLLANEKNEFEGAKETYWCSEYYKCHALKEGDHIFCVLYTSTVPTHTMRLITQKTLKLLLSDRQVCW